MKARFDSTRVLTVVCMLCTIPSLAADPQAPSTRPAPANGETLPQAASADERYLPPPPPLPPKSADRYVSPWLSEVLKLVEAGLDDSVLLAFIDKAGTFNLTAEQIIELNELGLRSDVVTVMIQHDAELAAGLRPEPAPPTKSGLPRLQARGAAASHSPSASPPNVAAAPGESIVNPSPAPDYYELMRVLAGPLPSVVRSTERSPVREPVPVPLTSTIVVHRTAGRLPNTLFLNMVAE